MRYDSAITTISWIPSEAVRGLARASFSVGVTHYDEPPPDALGPDAVGTLTELQASDRLRFAQHLHAWIELDASGRIVDHGCTGHSAIGATTVRMGTAGITVAAHSLPDRCPPAEVGDGWVSFTRTAGGRTGVPAPRTVRRPPYVQLRAPVAWTTVKVTVYADGRVEAGLVGASPFPRHWVYDRDGVLVAKSGLTRFSDWWSDAFGAKTPWGDYDEPALVAPAESGLERTLSSELMGGARPRVRRLGAGEELCRQGEPGEELFVVLDGMFTVEVDGQAVAEVGPGAVLGERAALEGGTRTSTVRAITPATVAAAPADRVDVERLGALAGGHRREATTR